MLYSPRENDDQTARSNASIDSVLGVEIEAVSDATIQTVDLDFLNDELTPRVNMVGNTL